MQGFEKNYAYYSSTRVAQAEDPQYRPIFTRPAPGSHQAALQPQPPSSTAWAQLPQVYAPMAQGTPCALPPMTLDPRYCT